MLTVDVNTGRVVGTSHTPASLFGFDALAVVGTSVSAILDIFKAPPTEGGAPAAMPADPSSSSGGGSGSGGSGGYASGKQRAGSPGGGISVRSLLSPAKLGGHDSGSEAEDEEKAEEGGSSTRLLTPSMDELERLPPGPLGEGVEGGVGLRSLQGPLSPGLPLSPGKAWAGERQGAGAALEPLDEGRLRQVRSGVGSGVSACMSAWTAAAVGTCCAGPARTC